MNLSATSATSGNSALWSLLASRQTSRSSETSQTCSDADTSASRATPPGPPPPPPGFDLSAISTSQFATMGQPPDDPIASLDSDDDGSVSADEFGLDSANDAVKALFSAIDSDGSGALSMDEIDSFREQMTRGDASSGTRPPPPPSSGAGQGGDVASFLQALAERYAQMQGSGSTTVDSTTAATSTIDATA